MRNIKGIIFDIGDILYDARVWRKWLTRELNSRGYNITYFKLIQRWEGFLVDVYKGNTSYWEHFILFLKSLGVPNREIGEIMFLAKNKGTEVQKERHLFNGVMFTLANLQKNNIRLTALSDSESSGKKIKSSLKKFDVDRFFCHIISSKDIGKIKPEPAAFKYAVEAMNLRVNECAFVGHDFDELDGAKAFGLFSIAFNNETEVPADMYLSEFKELNNLFNTNFNESLL